jgi:hypothetical protein
MAIDPLTLALIASGAQAATGIGKAAFGASQSARGRKALANAYEAPTGKPSEYAELLKQARASDLAQRRVDEINRSMASSTAALQQAGSRGVIGGIGAVTEAGSRAKTGVLSQQQAEIMRALERGTVGAEYERRRQVDRQTQEREVAQRAIEAGVQNIAGGLGDIGSAAITGVEAYTAAQEASKPADSINIYNGMLTEEEQTEKERKMERERTAEKGMKVQKTPGTFSHSKNPIDIMQKGAKIGEMTGGEYIFNPKQAKQMKKLASSGNTELHKFVKSLLNKPQFK